MFINLAAKKLNIYLILMLFIPLVVFGQKDSSDNLSPKDEKNRVRADEILSAARKAISKKTDVTKLKNFFLSVEGTFNGGIEIPQELEYFVEQPDKIRYNQFHRNKIWDSSFIQKLNDGVYGEEEESINKGTKVKSKSRKSLDPEEPNLLSLKVNTEIELLPFTLNVFRLMPLDLKFVGVAESENGKADVLEATDPQNGNFKLLFDRNSHLLLMMIRNYTIEDKQIERKFYYSDYREDSGLFVPHKITVQGNTDIGTDLFIESNLKKIDTNPVFKPDVFEIKDK